MSGMVAKRLIFASVTILLLAIAGFQARDPLRTTESSSIIAAAQPGAGHSEALAVQVPVESAAIISDDCTMATDISAELNDTSFHTANHVAIWLPHPLMQVRPQDVNLATNNFVQDTPTCGYSEDGVGWPDHHSRSVWFKFTPVKDGALYLTSYDPMYTRGGIHDTSGMTYRSDYDTVITVFTTEGGNWCGTFTSEDWLKGPHNSQWDDRNFFNAEHSEPKDFPMGGNSVLPLEMDGITWPMFRGGRNYGSYRERAANDYFHPGNHFAGSMDCVFSGVNKDQTAVAAEVKAGTLYYILVQHYWYPAPTGYCSTHLVLDATLFPTPDKAGTSPVISVNAQDTVMAFASNGRVWADIASPYEWLANYHPTGVSTPQIPFAEFAYDPFNAAYFFYDDPAFAGDGDTGTRTAGNRRADTYWVNKNFFAEGPRNRNDRIDDFTAFGFASRSAQSQMHNWWMENQQWIDAGRPDGYSPLNRWFIDTRAVDNENWGGADSLNLMRNSSGIAYSFDDFNNDFVFDASSNAAQNDCNTVWPPIENGYNFLSATGSPVATIAAKVPVTVWQKEHGSSRTANLQQNWERHLQYTHNAGGDHLSGEFVVHVANDTVNPAAILPQGDIGGALICYTYDEDDGAPCAHGPSNAGDTGPTWGHCCYLGGLGLNTVEGSTLPAGPFKVLAAAVGLDDTVSGYDCHLKAWNTDNAGLLVPADNRNPDIMPRQSYAIYFIDQTGALWVIRDKFWYSQSDDPVPNGMPDIYDIRNYEILLKSPTANPDEVKGADLRSAVAMTYNATTGEIIIALHGTGGPFGTVNSSQYNGSKLVRLHDRGPAAPITLPTAPVGYKGLYIHDPKVIFQNGISGKDILLWNHESAPGAPQDRIDYIFNFDNTTGFSGLPLRDDGTAFPLNPGFSLGTIEAYPPGGINPNWYGAAAQVGPDQGHLCWSMPTFNAGLAIGPSDPRWDGAVWRSTVRTQHIFGIAGRDDYIQEAVSPADPVQKGGADPNYWMTHILDFMGSDASITSEAADFAWRDSLYAQLNTWAQDLPYNDRCEGYFHGMTGLDRYHDNSRPDIWIDSITADGKSQIEDNDPATTCTSDKTGQTMYDICWLTPISIDWYSWDFVGTGVVGYDAYMMVYTNKVANGVYNPANWTAISIFPDAEAAGPDRMHLGKAHEKQSFTYMLPCEYTGESFIRIVAYDREGSASFHDSHPFYLGVQSNLTADLSYLDSQVIHRTDPGQPHRIIPIQWLYTPDTCILDGADQNRTSQESGRIEFDITADGGSTWQCMHMLDSTGEEVLVQCIDPNLDQVGGTNLHKFDLVIPDYYADQPAAPSSGNMAIRMYWRSQGCSCPQAGRSLVFQSPLFSISDELGPCIAVSSPSAGQQYMNGQSLPIRWASAPGIWEGQRKACDGGFGDGNPVVKAWFSSDPYDNVATSTMDVILCKEGSPYFTIASGLAVDQVSYDWQIPRDFALGSYSVRLLGRDGAQGGGNTSYFADTTLPYPRDEQTDSLNSLPSGIFTISAAPLPGDCDGNGRVNIGEVQKAVNMFLGSEPPGCGVDCDGNGRVSIGELQKVINAFLGTQSSC